MISSVFCFYDVKADDYGIPFFVGNKDLAIRLLTDIIKRGEGLMAQHPEDFYLYMIGTYDSSQGYMDAIPEPVRICSALEVLQVARGAAVGGDSPLKSQSAPAEVETSIVDGFEE